MNLYSGNDVDRAELLRRLDAEYHRFNAALRGPTSEQMLEPGADGWTAKDLLAHFITHEQRALDEVGSAVRGETPAPLPADNDSSLLGAVFALRLLSVDEIRALWERSVAAVRCVIEGLADADFAVDSPVANLLDEPIDGALANNTYEHWADHLPQILNLSDSR